jgi:hypothetical protein
MARLLAFLLCAAAAALGADVTGTWKFTVETSQGSGNPTFTFKQDGEKIAGTYSGLFGEANVAGTVKGDRIEFHFKLDMDGQVIEVKYTGTIVSSTSMKGTAEIADLGSATWTAEKQ